MENMKWNALLFTVWKHYIGLGILDLLILLASVPLKLLSVAILLEEDSYILVTEGQQKITTQLWYSQKI